MEERTEEGERGKSRRRRRRMRGRREVEIWGRERGRRKGRYDSRVAEEGNVKVGEKEGDMRVADKEGEGRGRRKRET